MLNTVAGLALALTLAPAQADGVEIRWKLAKGDTFYARTITNMNQTIDVAGMQMEQKQDQTIVHRYKVLEAGPKGTVVEQTVTKADIEGNLPMGAEIAGRMKGAVLTFTLDDKFKVTKVEGYDKYIDRIAGDDEMSRKILRMFMNEETLKLGIQDLFGFAPGKPVRPGDEWKRDNTVSLGPLGDLQLVGKFKLVGVENGVAKISTDAEARYQAPKEAADAGGFSITKGDLKVETFTGSVSFDLKAGRLKESRSEMTMSGTLTVSVGGAETDVGIKQRLTTTSTVSDKNLGDD